MNKNRTNRAKLFMSAGLLILVTVWCCQLMALNLKFPSKQTSRITNKIKAPNLDPKVLNLALTAYKKAKQDGLTEKDILTIVDYSLPSSEKRMWVINMQDSSVLHNTYVAHGIGSGDKYARKFSNQPGSHMSSLGVFVTGDTYRGHYGISLNLHGLDGKFNSNAHSRRIVVHAAPYVDENIVKKIGRIGRSFGCLSLNKKVADKIMHIIKDGSLVFCYYPDKKWLNESEMLKF